MIDDLKPCQFCGAPAKLMRWITNYGSKEGFAVSCSQCEISTDVKDEPEQAISIWNRRAGEQMSKLRKSAQGKPCMVRLPGCSGGGDDTVLAHYRLAGYCGVGMKPPDELGAWACQSNCHDIVDGRKRLEGWTKEQIRLAHAEGVLRTIAERERGSV